jgi:hypothetical protein
MSASEVTPDDLPKDSPGLKGLQVTNPAPPSPPEPLHFLADPRFLDPLILEYIDGHSWKLVSEFSYHTDCFSFPRTPIHIPLGFITDFASVPKLLWNVMPPTGKYGKAAVVHDFLYRTPHMATKAEADNVFLEAMTALGVGRFTRQTMYWGVRMFGGSSYKGGL